MRFPRLLQTTTSSMTLAALTLALGASIASADLIHVNAAQTSGANDGTSWANAYQGSQGLEQALNASTSGDEIWVAAGTYLPTASGSRFNSFILRNGVAIYGGFDGTEVARAQRDVTANETILSGDLAGNDGNISENSYHVVTASNVSPTAVLDGFTIRGGNANQGGNMQNQIGGGIRLTSNGSPTIANCLITQNRCTFGGGAIYFTFSSPQITNVDFIDNVGGAFGGAFDMFNNCNPTLTDCTFRGNSASRAGAVELFQNCSPTFRRCLFEDNTATGGTGGGAMFIANGGNAQMIDCDFVNNTASRGGAISHQNSSPDFTNSTFISNQTSGTNGQGGAVYSTASSGDFTNCLFAGNRAANGGVFRNLNNSNPNLFNCTLVNNIATQNGGGLSNVATSPDLTSCIVWNNLDSTGTGPNAQINDLSGAATTVMFSNVQGGWAGAGQQNIDADPQFLNQTAGNFRIPASSPCTDTGDPNFNPPTNAADLDGHARLLCARVDMGAYEYGLGDLNCDGDVDLHDFAELLDCTTGPGGLHTPDCDAADADGDMDVDWNDFADIQLVVSIP